MASQEQSAVPVLRPLLTACRQTGDRPREAQALLLLGATLVDLGSYWEAIGITDRAPSLCRTLGDLDGAELASEQRQSALRALGSGWGRWWERRR
ncbi:hypothetical protein [Streptomyces sp. NPDC054961]